MTKIILGTRDTSAVPEFAGSVWVRLQYMLGLQRLGHETYWVDRLGPVDPYRDAHSLDYLAERFARTARDFGFEDRYSIVYAGGQRHFGMSEDELQRVIDEADLLVNISGHLPHGSPLQRIPRRAYVDVDPGFTQIWAQEVDIGLGRHTHFFTIGQNVGGPGFTIPTGDVEWVPLLPPVVLDQWEPFVEERSRRFSTVADWRGSQMAMYDGVYYGTKRDEFVKLLRVPLDSGQRIELALCIGPDDHEDLGLLRGHEWKVRDAFQYAGDAHSYREFIRYSRAEFSAAKAGYVRSMSGWISDRTACYLASGKPAVVQLTGFESSLPTGKGLLGFSDATEAVAAIRTVNNDYLAHCRAAREIAEEHFDSDRVLGALLDRVGLG